MEGSNSIYEVQGWRRLALGLLALLVRAWGRTLRFEADAGTQQRLAKADEPAALVIWFHRYNWHRLHRSLHRLPSISRLKLEDNVLTSHT